MSYQTALKINEVIREIDKGQYLLPSIQREFVWKEEQIENLFDSLMQGYPIGSFLFWKVESENKEQYEFYGFLKNFHERKNKHNEKVNIRGENDITAILDGQQRLTSLYIGLKGTYASKIPYKRWDNEEAYPIKKLYLNILNNDVHNDNRFEFKFLTEEAANSINDSQYWYEVGKILEIKDLNEIIDYIEENIIYSDTITISDKKIASKIARTNLSRLFEVIFNIGNISYYLEKNQDLDKVLNIFIRVNSGGTILSYSDLLLSIASAQWEKYDAREEIHELVDETNEIGNGFNISKDFVLKSALVLTDLSDIAFKVNNFNKTNMKKIENNWENIKLAIKWAVQLISDFGFSRDNMKSNNAIIPIAYYFLTKNFPQNYLISDSTLEDRIRIKKWFTRSLIKRVFSGQPDNVIRPIRKIIKENNTIFPFENIVEEFKGTTKSIVFDNIDIEENLMELRYGNQDLLPALMLIYPEKDSSKSINIDHIYAKAKMKRKFLKEYGLNDDKIEYYLDNVDNIANLQLLYQIPNIEKKDSLFKEWFNKNYSDTSAKADYRHSNFIPEMDYDLENFEEFICKRKVLLEERFKNILL